MAPELKHDIANATTIAGLGSALMAWETPLTILLILTGILLNVSRLISWWEGRRK